MPQWNDSPAWTPKEQINDGRMFMSMDEVTPSQVNALVDNMQYLYMNEGDFDVSNYPIGSIYFSTIDVSPASLFGGNWERLTDRFLVGAGNTYTAGSKGGAVEHTHGIGNIWADIYILPDDADQRQQGVIVMKARSHTDKYISMDYVLQDSKSLKRNSPTGDLGAYRRGTAISGNLDNATHLPPYEAVYMWKRLADDE